MIDTAKLKCSCRKFIDVPIAEVTRDPWLLYCKLIVVDANFAQGDSVNGRYGGYAVQGSGTIIPLL
jgi:hypothetical protein